MNGLSIVVSVLPTPDDARRALRELRSIGVGIECLTLVGKGWHIDEQLAGYCGDVAGPSYCGRSESFWQALWSMPTGSAFVHVPALGTLVLAGELSISIVRQLQAPANDRTRAPLGGALESLGIPREAAMRYETAVRADQVLVIARREAGAVGRIAQLLGRERSIEVGVYGAIPADAGSAAASIGTAAAAAVPARAFAAESTALKSA